MDVGVLQLVLLLVIKDETVFLDVAHDWSLPAWALQESDQTVKDPVVLTFDLRLLRHRITILL